MSGSNTTAANVTMPIITSDKINAATPITSHPMSPIINKRKWAKSLMACISFPVVVVHQAGLEPATSRLSVVTRYKLAALPLSYWCLKKTPISRQSGLNCLWVITESLLLHISVIAPYRNKGKQRFATLCNNIWHVPYRIKIIANLFSAVTL